MKVRVLEKRAEHKISAFIFTQLSWLFGGFV